MCEIGLKRGGAAERLTVALNLYAGRHSCVCFCVKFVFFSLMMSPFLFIDSFMRGADYKSKWFVGNDCIFLSCMLV